MGKTFTSINPANGQIAGRYPIFTAKEVGLVVDQARIAANDWSR